MPQRKQLRVSRSNLIWLALIVVVGVIVGIAAGVWWGVGAAALVLVLSEVVERVQRSRR